MKTLILSLLASLLATTSLSKFAIGEDWPGWRGPRGDGTVHGAAPTKWDGATGENVAWKTPLPGKGHSSPIVFGDRVYLTSCLEDQQRRVVICLDRKHGKVVWQTPVLTAPLESIHRLNSCASGTPVTDGKRIFVSFLEVGDRLIDAPNVGSKRKIKPGEMVVACLDNEGTVLWTVKPGGFISAHGYCSSPVLYKDLVVINGDHDGESYIVALDQSTGKEVWRTPRKYKTRSYVTPLIRTIDGHDQLVVSGSKRVVSLNPADGSVRWFVEGPTEQYVASMVYDGEKFYMAAGFPSHHVLGIDPRGTGEVTESHVVWHSKDAACYVPSPVVIGKYLMVADDRGTANCFDTKSGDRLWKARLSKRYSASLLAVGDNAYFTADDGTVTIVRAGKELDVVAENKLGEYTFASPAVSRGQLFLRGEKHLFCIGQLGPDAGK